MPPILKLGNLDENVILTNSDKQEFFKLYHRYHEYNWETFRDHDRNSWRDFKRLTGFSVKKLQSFLHERGFMPNSNRDGIFGYATQAAVRLFQEYVRTIEGIESVGIPDGIVGKKTNLQIERWENEELHSQWDPRDFSNEEFIRWITLLRDVQKYYTENPSPSVKKVNDHLKKRYSSSLAINDWTYSSKDVHLVGIRRNAHQTAGTRPNDDLFILLVNGLVFKFWGSTDPSPIDWEENPIRPDEPYLAEGQHVYNFGWHKAGSRRSNYRALKPRYPGVLVFRDHFGDNALSLRNIEKGLHRPNKTINIHWSGEGRLNFSEGCPVISGRSYINHLEKVIDCRNFAASGSRDLDPNTKAAYNVLADLMLVYSPKSVSSVLFTLLHEEVFEQVDGLDTEEIQKIVTRITDL